MIPLKMALFLAFLNISMTSLAVEPVIEGAKPASKSSAKTPIKPTAKSKPLAPKALTPAGATLPSATPAPVRKVVLASIIDGDGKKIGRAVFHEMREGVTVRISARGLKAGLHGVHVHEVGRCEVPGFESAGGHFNPGQAEHGLKNPQGAHAGDLPNLNVGEDGTVKNVDFRLEGVRLDTGSMGLLRGSGTSLVIHANGDDQLTNPSGASGPRIACGVIRSPDADRTDESKRPEQPAGKLPPADGADPDSTPGPANGGAPGGTPSGFPSVPPTGQ